jgi:hypothetical protein
MQLKQQQRQPAPRSFSARTASNLPQRKHKLQSRLKKQKTIALSAISNSAVAFFHEVAAPHCLICPGSDCNQELMLQFYLADLLFL